MKPTNKTNKIAHSHRRTHKDFRNQATIKQ